MPYPTNGRDRAAWWERHIQMSEKQLEPRFKVGRRILHLYENVPYTDRERFAQEHAANPSEDVGRVHPSLTYAWINQTMANMVAQNPRFRVSAKRRDGVDGEVVVSKVINYWYDETDQLHQDRRCLQDAFTYGFSVKKVGWVADVRDEEEGIVSTQDTDLVFDDPEEENLFLATGQQTRVEGDHDHVDHIEKNSALLDDPTISDEIKDEVIRPHIQDHEERLNAGAPDSHIDIAEESPFGMRVWPEDFRIDPLARDGLKDARWIAFRIVKPIDEVKDNPNYSNTSKLKPERLPDTPSIDSRLGEDDGFGMVTLWEVWARNFKVSGRRRRNIMLVFAEQGEDGPIMLRHEDEWPYDRLDGYPALLLKFGQGTKTWLQKPDLALAGFDNIQLLMNESLDSMLNIVRKQKNIFFYDDNIFQNDEVTLAVNAPDNSTIGVPGLSQNPNAIQALPFVQIPGDKGAFIELIQNLADRAAGTPQAVDTGGDTATEAAIEERRTSAREGLRLDAFEKFQIETAEAFWRMHTQFQPDIEVEIDERAREFSTVDDDIVKGAFRFAIDVGSGASIQALERKQWLDLLNLMSGLVEVAAASGQPVPDLPKIAEQLLTRGYDVMNPEELWPAIGQNTQGPLLEALQGAQGGQNGLGGPANPAAFQEPTGSESAQLREAVTV